MQGQKYHQGLDMGMSCCTACTHSPCLEGFVTAGQMLAQQGQRCFHWLGVGSSCWAACMHSPGIHNFAVLGQWLAILKPVPAPQALDEANCALNPTCITQQMLVSSDAGQWSLLENGSCCCTIYMHAGLHTGNARSLPAVLAEVA